MNKLTR